MGEYADLPALSEIVLARPAGYLTDGRVNGRFSAPCGRSDRISERGLCKVLCARQGVRQVRQSLVRGDTDMDDVKFAVHDETASARRPHYYGVHHLALNTDDMKMTVDFYVGVLGMRLVHAMKVPPGVGTGPGNRGNPPFEEIRHYFFDMGRDGLLAFFEIPRGAKPKGDRDAIGTMQHVAFAVSPETAVQLHARLTEQGIDCQLVEHARGRNI